MSKFFPGYRAVRIAALLTAGLLHPGCASPSDPTGDPDRGVFEIEVSGETFRTEVFGSVRVKQLDDRLSNGVRSVINGELIRGDGGINEGWSWHMDPQTVEAVDASIELCDGRPSMVEADLDYWVDVVGQFCPWGAKVVRRIS